MARSFEVIHRLEFNYSTETGYVIRSIKIIFLNRRGDADDSIFGPLHISSIQLSSEI